MDTRKCILASIVFFPLSFAPFFAQTLRTNPPINPQHRLESNVPTPPEIRALLRRSCYNCHSNETQWPWYSSMPLASRLIVHDVVRARRVINFSEWSEQTHNRPAIAAANLLASCSAVQLGEMPKAPYPLLHPEARLSKTDIAHFCAWTTKEAQRLSKGNIKKTPTIQRASVAHEALSGF